jgi:hypothetical protein
MQDAHGPRANLSSRGVHVPLLPSQRQRWQTLLAYIWQHSAFYRDYYRSHGIQGDHLADLTPSDLPFMTKTSLMEHFDQAVTDPRLRKRELEEWLRESRDPAELFDRAYPLVRILCARLGKEIVHFRATGSCAN